MMIYPKRPDVVIPQILALVRVTKTGKINLRNCVRRHLGLQENSELFLNVGREICISAKKSKSGRRLHFERTRVLLPEEILKRIYLKQGALAALIERENAIALKAFEISEKEGERARWYDLETPTKVTRWIEKNPEPEVALKRFAQKNRDLKLNFNVRLFLEKRQTLDSLLARLTLGIANSSDEQLKHRLIQDRMQKQQEAGCWGCTVQLTARNLRELADLGMNAENPHVKKAAGWLLARPQSPYTPGLWFATDESSRIQEEVIRQRKKHSGRGSRPRFKAASKSEEALVKTGDPLIEDPCGARIMWTSALVLDALLKLGFEKENRVQAALRFLLSNPRWCDNTYQHGFSNWKRTEPLSSGDLKRLEKGMVQQFRYGGIYSPEFFKKTESLGWFRRISQSKTAKGEAFKLRMPLGIGEGCRVFMVRALSPVKDELLKKLIEINIWQFAGNLNITDEITKTASKRQLSDRTVFFLQIFTHSGLPVAKLVIARMLPWLIKIQNKDGSWGKDPIKDATTRIILEAMLHLRSYLPPNISRNIGKRK